MNKPRHRTTQHFLFALLVGTLAAIGHAQTTNKSDSCGPIPCVALGSSASVQTSPTPSAAAAPVVIRSTSPDIPNPVLSANPGGAADAAAPARHDFEEFVQSSLGHPLPLYGRGLFDNAPNTFLPADHIGVPADYVVGPGDELIIRSWGKIDIDARVTVDRNGQIFLPVVGAINVAGVAFHQLQHVVETSIRRQYRDFQLTVTLGQLRSIQIFVLGRARRPGAYVISSLSTLVDALFASGGPSTTGTLRDIQLKRQGKIVTHLDLYDLLLRGDKSADAPLIAGDILFIPTVGPQVAIDGDVNTPGIFEVKREATTAELLDDAGGLTSLAGTRRSVLEHIVDHTTRRSEELALDAIGLQRPLADGDILRIFPISPKIENAVTLRGPVAQPGRHTWHAGMHISDLIPTRDSLLTRAHYNMENTAGTPAGDHFDSQMRYKGADVQSHESEINWNYAVIERLDAADLSTHLLPFALAQAIAHPGSAEDKELQPGDIVDVYARGDQPLPQQAQAKFIRIDGEVLAPGTYRLQEGETLRDLVRHAGGFTTHTYLYAAELNRESVRLEQEVKLRQIIAREQREALSPANQPRTAAEAPGSAQGDLALRQAYLAKLGEIHPTGRIVLKLHPTDRTLNDVPDFAVEDGDHFFLPAVPGTVTVLGSVYNEGALRFTAGEQVRQYIAEAGGPARDADPRREFIIRADGTLVSRQAVSGLGKLPVFPGDSIVVPPKFHGPGNGLEVRDWLQVLSSFSITALAIKALQN